MKSTMLCKRNIVLKHFELRSIIVLTAVYSYASHSMANSTDNKVDNRSLAIGYAGNTNIKAKRNILLNCQQEKEKSAVFIHIIR